MPQKTKGKAANTTVRSKKSKGKNTSTSSTVNEEIEGTRKLALPGGSAQQTMICQVTNKSFKGTNLDILDYGNEVLLLPLANKNIVYDHIQPQGLEKRLKETCTFDRGEQIYIVQCISGDFKFSKRELLDSYCNCVGEVTDTPKKSFLKCLAIPLLLLLRKSGISAPPPGCNCHPVGKKTVEPTVWNSDKRLLISPTVIASSGKNTQNVSIENNSGATICIRLEAADHKLSTLDDEIKPGETKYINVTRNPGVVGLAPSCVTPTKSPYLWRC